MIADSIVWKTELNREYIKFKNLLKKIDLSEGKEIPDSIWLKIEKFFFVSSFIIRKLNESLKLSDELLEIKIHVIKHERLKKEKRLTFMDKYHFLDYYDLSKFNKTYLNLLALCNIFIHSFVFSLSGNYIAKKWNKIYGVFVNSDKTKNKYLYFIKVSTFLRVVKKIVEDNVVSISINFKTGNIIKSNKFNKTKND